MLIDRALALIDDLSDAERLQLAEAAISAVRGGSNRSPGTTTAPGPTTADASAAPATERKPMPPDDLEALSKIRPETIDALEEAHRLQSQIDWDAWKD